MRKMGIAALALTGGVLLAGCAESGPTASAGIVAGAAMKAAMAAQDCETVEFTKDMNGEHLNLVLQQPVVFLDIPNKEDFAVEVTGEQVLEVTEPEGNESFDATYGVVAVNPGEATVTVTNRESGEPYLTFSTTVSAIGYELGGVSREEVSEWPIANIYPGFTQTTLVRGQRANFDGPESAIITSSNNKVLSVQGTSLQALSPGEVTLSIAGDDGFKQELKVKVVNPEGVNLFAASQVDLIVNNQTPTQEAIATLRELGFTVEVVGGPNDIPDAGSGSDVYLVENNEQVVGGFLR